MNLLWVGGDVDAGRELEHTLTRRGHRLSGAAGKQEALDWVRTRKVDAVLLALEDSDE